ncbi:hyaluronoglucosaminidase, partial [Friedmanniella endophytica]
MGRPFRRSARPAALLGSLGLALTLTTPLLATPAPAAAAPATPAPSSTSASRGAVAALAGHQDLAVSRTGADPVVVPTPQSIGYAGRALRVPSRAVVIADARTDAPARRLLLSLLRQHGARSVELVRPGAVVTPRPGQLVVLLGAGSRSDIRTALGATAVPDHSEGYALRVLNSATSTGVVIGGHDGAGQYYGVQTLRQLFQTLNGRSVIAPATVRDWPRMALRGAIEGFYGPPWSTADRLRQLAFEGDVKANSYIYSPKDDPYLRADWRKPYPASDLATIKKLVTAADAHHVSFTYALSPGVSICFSSAADRTALLTKLDSVYAIGVRPFSLPFDDISYTKWNCAGDQTAYGDPGPGAAGTAQVSLLNEVAQHLQARGDDVPVQTVPTEYSDLKDSPYKTEFREHLDPSVVIQWTGTDVVPPSITNADAATIEKVWGRKTFLWDNYPVNDYGQAAGRLLLAPYTHRQAGLADHLQGIVANPMNEQTASVLAEFGSASFAWNDRSYDAQRTWHQAMAYLTGGNANAARAMAVFADLEHLAPTFGTTPWQPQAPVLAARVKAF